jgi:HAE1 family hydrophobic/amphiphilic exporter-1
VDYTNLLRKRDYELTRAVVAAGRIRLRPILMTMLTTILALLPLAFFGGSGSELRTPMALTVVGGLLVSTVFTLILIPVIYHMFEGRRERRRLSRVEDSGDGQPPLLRVEKAAEQEVVRG